MKNVLKGIRIGFSIIFLSLIVMYLGLACYYADGFSYGTWINGISCTGKSVNEVNDELLEQIDYEGLTITDSDGRSYTILAKEVDFTYDFDEALRLYLDQQNPYFWIENLTGSAGEGRVDPIINYNEAVYEKIVDSFPFFSGKTEDERIVEIFKGDQGYYLVDDRTHVVNEQKTKEMIKEAFERFEPQLNLEEAGCYEDFPMTEEMKQQTVLWQKIEKYQDCGIIYQFGEEIYPVDGSVVCDFIMTDENGDFVLDENGDLCTDEEKVYEFIDRLADEYDTVGGIRQFHATRGDIVTVEGGIYGNKIDREAEKEYFLQAFLENRKEVHEPAYSQMALFQGKDDLGDT